MLFAISFSTCNMVCGCAGWSGSMLIANPLCWFCRDTAQISIKSNDLWGWNILLKPFKTVIIKWKKENMLIKYKQKRLIISLFHYTWKWYIKMWHFRPTIG
jgi:hypothetical protein